MTQTSIKSELHAIADKLSDTASYEDAMHELYVRMKLELARKAGEEGRLTDQDEVERRFRK